MKNKLIAEHSKFWLGKNFEVVKIDVESTMDLVRLASYRRAISNFVYILTGKNIPVRFAERATSRTDGSVVYIGGELSKGEFDSTVGLALHEAMHIVKSDFSLLSSWAKISRSTITAAKSRISLKDLGNFTKYVFNVVEDRYIDAWAYEAAPGYRGYYQALYDRYFHHPDIDAGLQSMEYRTPTLKNYRFRFTNLVNENSDLDALPGLRQAHDLLDMPNILRPELASPKERLELAFQIVEIFIENLVNEREKKQNKKSEPNSSSNNSGQSEASEEAPNEPAPEPSSDSDCWGEDETDEEVTNEKLEEIIKEQEAFVERTNVGSSLSSDVVKKLSTLENSGVELTKVGGEEGIPEIECIVVTNLTRELIESEGFPFSPRLKSVSENPEAAKGVKDGIAIGTALGRKLQLRREVRLTKFTRLPRGKIDRRLLPSIGYQGENLFYQTTQDKYKNVHLHVSVDASGSMMQNWKKTMTMLVAIAKAASMIDNLSVMISFRTGTSVSGKRSLVASSEVPYVVIAYDSRKDKFQKIIQLFPLLFANGSTPEGLAFQAILKHIPETTYESNSYFVNLSDGEPAFGAFYKNELAANHTRKQVGKIRDKGIEVLSYFIEDARQVGVKKSDRVIGNEIAFRFMYGKDAQFIDVESVIQIAHTMNKKFLVKEN